MNKNIFRVILCIVLFNSGCQNNTESGSTLSSHTDNTKFKTDTTSTNEQPHKILKTSEKSEAGLPITAEKVSTIEVKGLEGETIYPFEKSNANAIVFIFVCTDCPVACRYVPEFNKIHDEYEKKGIKFWLVYSDDRESEKIIKEHLKDYQHKISACCDYDQSLVQLTKATVTPEAAVFNSKGELVYRGRIDNRYHDFGKTRTEATKHELRDALDAILDNRDIAIPKTKAVGCFIPTKT